MSDRLAEPEPLPGPEATDPAKNEPGLTSPAPPK